MTEPPSVFRPLRHHRFRHLALGRALTYFANAMAPLALAFAVLDLGGSAVDVGIVVGARSIANVVLLLFGGVLADRLPRGLVLQGASLAAAAAQGTVAAALLLDAANLPVLVVLGVLNGGVSAVAFPASAALTPQTVPTDELRSANALARMGVNLGIIAGSSLGGMLAAVAGPGWGLACNAVAFTAAAAAYRQAGKGLPRRGSGAKVGDGAGADGAGAGADRAGAGTGDGAGAKPGMRAAFREQLWELREGWREFVSRTWVWVVVLQFFVVNAVTAGGIQVLGPTIADDSFGRTAWGLVLAIQMAGALAGGFLVARSRSRHMLRIGVAVIMVEALPLLALAESADLLVLMAAMFVNGIAIEQFGVAWDLSLQENVPEDRLARVYSYDALGSLLALPVGEMAVGPLAERIGTRATLLGGATLVLLATLGTLCSRDVRSLTVRGTQLEKL